MGKIVLQQQKRQDLGEDFVKMHIAIVDDEEDVKGNKNGQDVEFAGIIA